MKKEKVFRKIPRSPLIFIVVTNTRKWNRVTWNMQGRVTVASVPGLYIDANRRKLIDIPFASSEVRCNVADTVYVCTGSFPCPLSAMNRDTSTSIHFSASPVPCVRSTNLSHRLVFFSLGRRRCRNCSSKVNYILSDFCAERELNLCRIVQNWR